MKPVRILIEQIEDSCLSIHEIKYTFQVLLSIIGLPCHFTQDQKENIDIYYGRVYPTRCKLFIERAKVKRENIRAPIKAIKEKGYIFLVFDKEQDKEEILRQTDTDSFVGNDIILSSYYLLSGWNERFISRDWRDRHLLQESFFYQNQLLHDPLVNHYVEILRSFFAPSYDPLPMWPGNKRYAVALSHDVDYPEMIRWIEGLRYLGIYKSRSNLSKVMDILKGRESFWRFEDWVHLEKRYGMKSAIYFCGRKGNLFHYFLRGPDPFYDIRRDKYKRLFNFLVQNGFEVGLHSSYWAYRSVDQFSDEKKRVETVLGEPVLGNRHHYWHLNPDNPTETARMHHQIGLLYDTSVCFGLRAGFRFGICSPFHLYDPVDKQAIPTLQLPTCLMDDHLFGYFKYSYFDRPQFEMDALIESSRKYGGVLMVDYHIRVFNSTFFPRWIESYEYLLNRITERKDYYSDTPLHIAKYWREREERILRESKDEVGPFN